MSARSRSTPWWGSRVLPDHRLWPAAAAVLHWGPVALNDGEIERLRGLFNAERHPCEVVR